MESSNIFNENTWKIIEDNQKGIEPEVHLNSSFENKTSKISLLFPLFPAREIFIRGNLSLFPSISSSLVLKISRLISESRIYAGYKTNIKFEFSRARRAWNMLRANVIHSCLRISPDVACSAGTREFPPYLSQLHVAAGLLITVFFLTRFFLFESVFYIFIEIVEIKESSWTFFFPS